MAPPTDHCPTGLTHHEGRGLKVGLLTAVLVAAVAAAACGGTESYGIVDGPDIDTTTLVGTWKGSIDGGSDANSYGFSNITTVLRADSTLTTMPENPRYCIAHGVWTVSGTTYRTRGTDCDGVLLASVAPLSPRRLTGTWTASSGRAGTFTMAKQ